VFHSSPLHNRPEKSSTGLPVPPVHYWLSPISRLHPPLHFLLLPLPSFPLPLPNPETLPQRDLPLAPLVAVEPSPPLRRQREAATSRDGHLRLPLRPAQPPSGVCQGVGICRSFHVLQRPRTASLHFRLLGTGRFYTILHCVRVVWGLSIPSLAVWPYGTRFSSVVLNN
jgi:hypothetical protein